MLHHFRELVPAFTALTMSGQPTRRFAFEAFLPYDKKERAQILENLRNETRTIIIYEAPHHLKKTLKECREYLGNRNMTVCKELTKRYEQKRKSTLDEMIAYYEENEPRGEYVLIFEGKSLQELKEEKTTGVESAYCAGTYGTLS